VEGARALAAHLRRSSPHRVAYAELPGGQHGFDRFRSLRFEAVVDGVAAFLAQVGEGAAPVSPAPFGDDQAEPRAPGLRRPATVGPGVDGELPAVT
jgi:hypothetical protein